MTTIDKIEAQPMASEAAPVAADVKGEHLHALLLKLRARQAGELHPFAGQLTHAALLGWFGEVDGTLAAHLHTPNMRRPFTCSTLWSPQKLGATSPPQGKQMLRLAPGGMYWLRFTLLGESLFRSFMARFFQASAPEAGDIAGSLNLPTLRLGTVAFDVMEIITATPSLGDHQQDQALRWSGQTTYHTLVERALRIDLAQSQARKMSLEFCSPTAFSDGEGAWKHRMHLFPDPDRVFDNLARTWNVWAPAELSINLPMLKVYCRERVAVLDYTLTTHTVQFDHGAHKGFMGRCSYALMDQPSQDRRPERLKTGQVLHFLSAFAFYAGVGTKTAMGMGQTRVVKGDS
jgi:CRISPR-associated endoribonuclease Cas6